jgi:shikimate kinase
VRRDKIYLVGFLAAGKTTLARALGRRLDWRVEDLDALIEARERRTVADIFAMKGEAYFRAVEREVLHGLLPPRHVVVATGAGTFADADNRVTINGDGTSVWLDVPWARLLERLPTDGRRPLAPDRDTMERLHQVRRLAYQEAQIRIDAAGAPVEELVERTLDRLGY